MIAYGTTLPQYLFAFPTQSKADALVMSMLASFVMLRVRAIIRARSVTLLVALILMACAAKAQNGWIVARLSAPDYPLLAQEARIAGTVKLMCSTTARGQISHCDARSGHLLLRTAAVQNAMTWRWRRNPEVMSHGSKLILFYEFKLVGPGVRGRPKVEFAFEEPNLIRVVSEIPCSDHAPCDAQELGQLRK